MCRQFDHLPYRQTSSIAVCVILRKPQRFYTSVLYSLLVYNTLRSASVSSRSYQKEAVVLVSVLLHITMVECTQQLNCVVKTVLTYAQSTLKPKPDCEAFDLNVCNDSMKHYVIIG